MTAPARSIEVVQNIVLDTMSPFVERLRNLEAVYQDHIIPLISTPAPAQEPAQAPEEPEAAPVDQGPLQARLDAIVEMHRLDAVPALWTFVGGKREQAPEGLWEITCAVCKDHTLTWKQGDPAPRRCATVRTALGT